MLHYSTGYKICQNRMYLYHTLKSDGLVIMNRELHGFRIPFYFANIHQDMAQKAVDLRSER